ncbi:unnamed protein product [Moneuplotes crassus]|uniref:START domain-containing protein n=1 Tax=Euplotes crassus TaxID=5936 RepID=A0AAD1XDJ6_EUPCR|nr:unnamed protein product [Moneuplotes crassus]
MGQSCCVPTKEDRKGLGNHQRDQDIENRVRNTMSKNSVNLYTIEETNEKKEVSQMRGMSFSSESASGLGIGSFNKKKNVAENAPKFTEDEAIDQNVAKDEEEDEEEEEEKEREEEREEEKEKKEEREEEGEKEGEEEEEKEEKEEKEVKSLSKKVYARNSVHKPISVSTEFSFNNPQEEGGEGRRTVHAYISESNAVESSENNTQRKGIRFSEMYNMKLDEAPKFEDVPDLDSRYKNTYEAGSEFNIDYIYDLWKKFESTEKDEDWDQHVDEEEYSVWTTVNGPILSFKHPLIYSEMTFEGLHNYGKLKDILTDYEQALKWKPYLKYVKILDKFCQNGIIVQTEYSKIDYEVTQRDFVEKQIILETLDEDEQPVIVIFVSSVPSQEYPAEERITRCETLLSLTILGTAREDKLYVRNYMLVDPKIINSRILLSKYLHRTVKSTHDSIQMLLE